MGGFLGMRGTGDWSDTDFRPKDFRETLLFLYPNGDMPLTAILSKMKSERTVDPEFKWFTKTLASQAGAITNIYTDSAMSSAYTTGGSEGDVLYVNVALATAKQIRAGHVVLLRDASHYDVDVRALVLAVDQNGASSKVTVRLLEDDDNGASTDLSDADTLLIIGTAHAEGAPMPDAISYEWVKYYNYTQIFRTPVEMTRTQMQTKMRPVDAWKEAQREALELHGVEREKAAIWGLRTENTGDNGKPIRTTQGIIDFVSTNASDNVDDYTLNTDYAGDTWLTSGEDWLDEQLAQIFKYGSQERLGLCGQGALLGINRLVKNNGTFDFTPKTMSYGIKVVEWVTPFGTIYLKQHPLFTYETTNSQSIVVLDPKNIRERYIQQTKYYTDKSSGAGRLDGKKEEYLTELGFEFHHPETFGYLNGVGGDNGLTP